MDSPLPSPSGPVSGERPIQPGLEGMQPGAGERSPAVEAGPTPGAVTPGGAQPRLDPAAVAAAIAAVPTPAGAPVASQAGAMGATPLPMTAGDVDVIEPEWVDKAEEVVRAHQGDPYAEEEAIEELQQDYLKKRYGINVADASPNDSKPTGA